jgi:phage FluMu protein Com
MPIRFRCSYCNRLLGIATRKAGMETTCPHCGYAITVPVPQDDDGRTERINLDDVEAMLGQGATEVVQPGAVAAPPAPPPAEAPKPAPVYPKPAPPPPVPKARTAPAPVPKPVNPDDPPLFERDMDEILGKTAAPAEEEREKPRAVSGMDAMSLGEPARQIVISAQNATFLMIFVVVLLAIAFAAGYFLAPKG